MSILRFVFKAKGVAAIRKKMQARRKVVERGLSPIARRILTSLLKMVDDKFSLSARGGRPKGWPDPAPLTTFIKKNRASRRRPNPRLLIDSGRLRFGTMPFSRGTTFFRRKATFGIRNDVPWASTHQFGGRTRSNTVRIGTFKRRSPKSGRRVTVRGFTMKIAGGRSVPARPFFPSTKEYVPVVRRILSDYEKQIARGG